MGEFGIGQPLSRFEDRRLLTGGGTYTSNQVFSEQSFGYLLRSPHAHARLCGIETTGARASPGVLGVFTHQDYRRGRFGPHSCYAT
jgi:carbon-monoxide dehydrogenase large subunit